MSHGVGSVISVPAVHAVEGVGGLLTDSFCSAGVDALTMLAPLVTAALDLFGLGICVPEMSYCGRGSRFGASPVAPT